MDAQERARLVELFRSLSPEDLKPEPVDVPPALARLVGAALPRSPRAILFDIYGTIVMSAAGGEPTQGDARARGGEKARTRLISELSELGFPGGPEDFADAVEREIARTRREALSVTEHPEVDIEEIVSHLMPRVPRSVARVPALLLETWRNPCAAMPGAARLLPRLRERGIRLGIVSNAQFYTPLLIEALFGRPPEALGFEPELTAYSYETLAAKPGRGPFIRASSRLLESGIDTHEILVAGNSWRNDIAPARALGFMTLLFGGDARSFRPPDPPSPESGPDSILAEYDGFESILPRG